MCVCGVYVCVWCVCVCVCVCGVSVCVCVCASKTVPVKEMKGDEIGSLLDSLGFYRRDAKGEEVPEEFQHFPLHAPRDEL